MNQTGEKTNAEISAPKPKPPLSLKTRVWNKIGSGMILIGVYGPFLEIGQLMDPGPPEFTSEQLTYIFFGSILLLVLGVLIRARGIWSYLRRKVKRY